MHHQDKTFKKLQDLIPGQLMGTNVQPGDLNRALRRWKKSVKDSGIVQELFSRKEFEKPSVSKRKIKKEAIYRQEKESQR